MGREEVERRILESIKDIFEATKEYSDFDVISIGITKDEDGGYIVSAFNDYWNEGVKPINFGAFSNTWELTHVDTDTVVEG